MRWWEGRDRDGNLRPSHLHRIYPRYWRRAGRAGATAVFDPEQAIVASELHRDAKPYFHSLPNILVVGAAGAVTELRKLGYERLLSISALALAQQFSVAGISDFVPIDGGTGGAAERITEGQLIPIDA